MYGWMLIFRYAMFNKQASVFYQVLNHEANSMLGFPFNESYLRGIALRPVALSYR